LVEKIKLKLSSRDFFIRREVDKDAKCNAKSFKLLLLRTHRKIDQSMSQSNKRLKIIKHSAMASEKQIISRI
jgi:hypothetical protein